MAKSKVQKALDKMTKWPKITIHIKGGVLQSVHATEEMEVTLIDEDDCDCEPGRNAEKELKEALKLTKVSIF